MEFSGWVKWMDWMYECLGGWMDVYVGGWMDQ